MVDGGGWVLKPILGTSLGPKSKIGLWSQVDSLVQESSQWEAGIQPMGSRDPANRKHCIVDGKPVSGLKEGQENCYK